MAPTELARKLVHIPGGLVPPLFVVFFGWFGSAAILLYILAYSVIASVWERRGRMSPVFSALHASSRRPDEPFPVAPLEFLVAILLTGALFPPSIQLPALAVLALGDGVAGLVGRRWGGRTLPWNPKKSWAGLAAGSAAAVVIAPAYAWIGLELEAGGLLHRPLLSMGTTWGALAFLAIAYPVGIALLGAIRRATGTPRVANLSLARATALHVACLGAALPPLLVEAFARAWADPLPLSLGIDLAGFWWTPLAAAVVAMIAESLARRHDNLVVPFAYGITAAVLGYSW